jgi:hypothetical protein
VGVPYLRTVCTLINHCYAVCTLINHCYAVCTLINHCYTVCTLINHCTAPAKCDARHIELGEQVIEERGKMIRKGGKGW